MARTSGRRIIVGLLAIGLIAAGSAVMFHYETGNRASQFFGPEAGSLISQAPLVDLLKIEPWNKSAEDPQEIFGIAGRRWAVIERQDATKARGFINVRDALMHDGAYEWKSPSEIPGDWRMGLRFEAAGRKATVLFSKDGRQIGLFETGAKAALEESFASVIRGFFEDAFSSPQSGAAQPRASQSRVPQPEAAQPDATPAAPTDKGAPSPAPQGNPQ